MRWRMDKSQQDCMFQTLMLNKCRASRDGNSSDTILSHECKLVKAAIKSPVFALLTERLPKVQDENDA